MSVPIRPEEGEAQNDLPSPAAGPRRRRRWRMWLALSAIAMFVLLLVLIAALPTLASTETARRWALSIANQRINGHCHLQSASLSWFGSSELSGIRITDADARDVFSAERVRYAGGIWGLALGSLDLGDVEIESPEVVLFVNAQDDISLVDAFKPRATTDAKSTPPAADVIAAEAKPLPAVRGKLLVRDGTLKVIREGREPATIKDISAQLTLATLSDISGSISVALADGGSLNGEWDIRQLVTDNKIAPSGARGKFNVRTDEDIPLSALTALLDIPALEGAAGGEVDLQMVEGAMSGNIRTSVAGMRSLGAAEAAPVSAELVGSISLTAEKLVANARLQSDSGSAEADLNYAIGGPRPELSEILSAALSGQSLAMPEFTLNAQANLDLARLGQAAPGLLRLRDGQRITGGSFVMPKLAIHGGATPSATGSLELSDVSAEGAAGTVRLEPVTLAFDMELMPGVGLEVVLANLNSSFASLSASGTATSLTSQYRCDMSRAQRELGQIFDMGDIQLAGSLVGAVDATRPSPERVDLALQATVEGLRISDGDSSFQLARGVLTQTGHFTLDNQRATRFDADKVEADLNDEVLLAGTGWYDLREKAFGADVQIRRGDLNFLATRADSLGVPALSRYGGSLMVTGSFGRGGADAPIATTGVLTATAVTVDGESILAQPATLTWSGVEIAPASLNITVASAELESTLASLAARDVRWQPGAKPELAGDLRANADIAPLLRVVSRVTRSDPAPSVRGRLTVDSRITGAGEAITVNGQAQIDQLEVGVGENTVKESRVQLSYDGAVDLSAKRVNVAKCDLVSAPLRANVIGTIERFDSDCVLALRGNYDADWQPLITLLRELAPATADLVVVSGSSASAFELRGPVNVTDDQPSFRGLQTLVGVGWQSARIVGVEMGEARLTPALRDGKLTIPPTTIPAAEGAVNLAGALDFRPGDPTLRIAGRLALIDRVPITPILSSQLLSRINPIFLRLAQVEGVVSLSVADVAFPFGASMEKTASGSGVLDLRTLKITPDALLSELLALGGVSRERQTVQGGATSLTVKAGRIHYEDFTLVFADDFDLRFRGSVGLDETLDLVVSIPIREALLTKLGVRGPTAEYVKLLTGSRVEIPLVGTREQPTLDLGRVDTAKLLEGLIKPAEPEKVVDDLLQGLSELGKKRNKPK